MAQFNITFNQDEVLQMLGDNTGTAFKKLLQETLNEVLRAESQDQIGAERYERTEDRQDSRNGTRERSLTTRIGTITLNVPRHRNVPFKTLVFDNYKRSEAALVTTMAEMVVGGVSTAKVGKVMQTICGRSFSKSAVSEACKVLDDEVSSFRTREIRQFYPFVMVDATYLKVREDHRIVSKALMIAMGFTTEGQKEIIGFSLEETESIETWTSFLRSLKKRGLANMRVLTSDAHEGILAALQTVFPDVAWQRCQTHFARNILDAVPKKYKIGLKNELTAMFNCDTLKEAREMRDEIIADYSSLAPSAMERLDRGFDDAMTVMEIPAGMRRCVRTTNYLERLNREVKRRSNVIGKFPNQDSVIRLMGSVLMTEHDRWLMMARNYYTPDVERLEENMPKLIEIARQQKQLRLAA